MTSRGKQPPQWIKRFLAKFLDARLLEGSLGDLEEKYSENIERGMSLWRANLLYITEALGFMKLASLRKEEPDSVAGQIIHIFTFFVRLVRKDKSYYMVSMFGLALSLASFLLITIFVSDELSYDSIHVNRDRVFRVTTHVRLNDLDFDLATSQFPAAHALQSEFPEVEEAVRLHTSRRFIEYNDKKFEEKIVFADDNFFKVFSFPLIHGDPNTILNEPGNIILSERMVTKYFGTHNAVGSMVMVGEQAMKVVGVMKGIDTHSHVKFDILSVEHST